MNTGVDYNENEKHLFYNPQAYCLLGNYDLAVISVIDDFSFSSKYFHPYSHLDKRSDDPKAEMPGFNYHITKGSSSVITGEEAYLIPKAKDTFLRQKDRYPFIGISSIKVKNSLLIGVGYEVVYLSISALKTILTKFKKNKNGFDFLVFEPIEWNEISVILFADNLKTIANAILVIRELSLNFAINNCEEAYNVQSKEVEAAILEKSLIAKTLINKTTEILNSHLFTHTYSNLGIDIEWLQNFPAGEVDKEIKCSGFLSAQLDDSFAGFTRWFVKPYYLESFLKKRGNGNKFNFVIGNGDIEIVNQGEIQGSCRII